MGPKPLAEWTVAEVVAFARKLGLADSVSAVEIKAQADQGAAAIKRRWLTQAHMHMLGDSPPSSGATNARGGGCKFGGGETVSFGEKVIYLRLLQQSEQAKAGESLCYQLASARPDCGRTSGSDLVPPRIAHT